MVAVCRRYRALRQDVEWLCDQERRRHALELDAWRAANAQGELTDTFQPVN